MNLLLIEIQDGGTFEVKTMCAVFKPRIAITLGDPCGVGPEVVIKALWEMRPWDNFVPVIIGEIKACFRTAKLLGMPLVFREIASCSDISSDGVINVINPYPVGEKDIVPAHPTEKTAKSIIKSIETAVQLAQFGDVDAISTAPINKKVLNRVGFQFPGHTEFLQFLTKSERAVMMLAGPKLKVSLVTIHVPLMKVRNYLSVDEVFRVIKITGDSLKSLFGIENPRIAVCGLNPHAGEEGMFGFEENEILAPAIEKFRNNIQYKVMGPYPADTVFFRALNGEFDAVVSMYHDQGLIPVKLLHFHDAVNVTLGLPIIRTSADHGTAYDISGKGVANSGSMKAAINLAVFMARNRSYS